MGSVLHDCLCVLLFLSHWAVAWFKIYCTGHFATGSSHKGRERERRREGEEMQRRRFPSHLPSPLSVLPHCQHRQLVAPQCHCSGTVVGGNYSSLFTNQWSSPGTAVVSWDLSRGSDWSVTQQSVGFYFSQAQQQLFYSIACLRSCSECIVQAICFHFWLKKMPACSTAFCAQHLLPLNKMICYRDVSWPTLDGLHFHIRLYFN